MLRELRRLIENVRARRAELVGMNQRNIELVYAENPRRHFPLADDKLLTKLELARAGVPTPETLAICPGLFAIPQVLASIVEREEFVVKPASGAAGNGILVVGQRAERGVWRLAGGRMITLDQIRAHLAQIVFGAFANTSEDRGFVERRVTPHPLFSELWPDGLSDVRVLVLRGEPFMAMVRVPTARSGGRANLHQGALALAVDLCSGRSVRAVHRRQVIERHPDTGVPLVGIELPRWDEIVTIAKRAAAAVPLGYLGVDVVVDREHGPLVLEINVRPGLEIQNVHGRGLNAALKRIA